MAVGRISGPLLKSNLLRQGIDLAFETDLLYLDVNNQRIGIKTDSPTHELDIFGTSKTTNLIADNIVVNDIEIDNSTIKTETGDLTLQGATAFDKVSIPRVAIPDVQGDTLLTGNFETTGNIHSRGNITADGDIILGDTAADNVSFRADINSNIIPDSTDTYNLGEPNKRWNEGHFGTIFADNIVGDTGLRGDNIELGQPEDSNLTDGAYTGFTETQTVTTAVDDLNEIINNVRLDAFVRTVDFLADKTEGGAGTTITLSTTVDGNANEFEVDWGDGTIVTTTNPTPSHTYSSNIGSPFTVSVTARNTNGFGTGSEDTETKEDYIIIYTRDPVVSFDAYDSPTGGNLVSLWDDGDTIYFENNTTNIGSADIQFTWNWGDGTPDDVVIVNADNGGTAGNRIAHTFALSTEQEQTRTVTLSLDSHSTADPAVIPTQDSVSYKIYDTHTPTLTLSTNTGINEESTNGLPVEFTNTTENTIGSFSTYEIRYRYIWGDGDSDIVNAGTLQDGDTGNTIFHTYTLNSSQQANGVPVDYTGRLEVLSNHSDSPFQSSDFTVHVEPDVRAEVSGTAVTTSDASGDNKFSIYSYTDLQGRNRALVRITNDSQNGETYTYNWNDSSSNNVVNEDGVSPGTTQATIDHDYTGEPVQNYTVNFTVSGTPDITLQNDVDNSITFSLKPVPAAPAGLSTKTLSLANNFQGNEPRLAAGFTDNTTTGEITAGADLTASTSKRYTAGTIETQIVQNTFDGSNGVLESSINGNILGSITFDTNNNATTDNTLTVTENLDFHAVNSSYPSDFYQVFSARITESLSNYNVGLNSQRLEHSTTGNTNYVNIVKDDLTATPSYTQGDLQEDTSGNYRYISGIPYYNSGSPRVKFVGIEVDNFIGQAYSQTNQVLEVNSGENQEGTSQQAIATQSYTYNDINGATSFLTNGIPNANTGNGIPYTLGDIIVDITSNSVRTVELLRFRMRNVNGISGFVNSNRFVQVHTANQIGINEQGIPVSDSLGDGSLTDDGVRISNFIADTIDTPAYSPAVDFYTDSPYRENSDPGVEGSQEATVRLGVIEHNITDYSSQYLPAGPNRSNDTGTQYFTFAFRRKVVANITMSLQSSTGIAGVWIALPGEITDSSSTLNGWLRPDIPYAGVGVPGGNVDSGGNGSNGIAATSGDTIPLNQSLNGSYDLTFGTANMTNTTGNVAIIRIALSAGQNLESIGIS